MQVIDTHSHLGNILEPGGASLIYKTGINMQKMFDPQAINEAGLMRTYGLGNLPYTLLGYWATRAQRARNATATLENMQSSLTANNVTQTICLPIAPYVTFDDLAQAAQEDKRLVPFTSIEWNRKHDALHKLEQDVQRGARGLKLHPIIQSRRLDDPLLLYLLEAFAKHKLPVLVHAGVSRYYLGKEMSRNEPANGRIKHVEQLVRTFPQINFIIGHAGLFQVDEVCRRLQGLPNVWVDTSFQSPERIRKLIATFGAEKVMFGSDWPYGWREPALKALSVACRGDEQLESMIRYHNAKDFLQLTEIKQASN